jgi:hypothetical protein
VIFAGGCGLQGLSFRADDRLRFVHPKSEATVNQPITIAWRMSGFHIAPFGSVPPSDGAGYFAIFVDQAPIRPGQTMRSVVSGDSSCTSGSSCTNATNLAEHEVFTTTHTSMTFPEITTVSSGNKSVQLHTFIIVLMNTAGHRIGESAWELDLRIPIVGG